MNKPEATQSVSTLSSLARQSSAFVHDFAGFAGWRGIWAATLAVLGAAFEGIGLLLLVPILSVVTVSESAGGWAHTILVQGLAMIGAQTRTERLSVLLGLFAVLIIVRALIVGARNIALARLETGFVEEVRGRLARRLAAAPWPVVSRLQHARVTHLMSGDIHRVGGATHYMVQFAASVIVIADHYCLCARASLYRCRAFSDRHWRGRWFCDAAARS